MKKKTYKLPDEFIGRIERYFPTKARDIFKSTAKQHCCTFRLNKLKIDEKQWRAFAKEYRIQTEAVKWFRQAHILKNMTQRDFQAFSLYKEGCIYLQNLSSMVPVIVLDPHENETVLDLCAAPGSKTTQIASMTRDKAHITAVEKIRPRFYRLQANCRMQGVTNIRLICGDGTFVLKKEGTVFDKVLVDAPCSSEGLFNVNNPKTFGYWSLRKIKEMQRKQKRLIRAGWNALKDGGTMVYSTCTYAPEENECVVQYLLDKYPGEVKIEAIELPFKNCITGLQCFNKNEFSPEIKHLRRIIPTDSMEGFFVAKLKKIKS